MSGRSTSAPSLANTGRGGQYLVPVVLLATVAIAHYLRFLEFGLYEDDYYFVGEPMGWRPQDAFREVADALTKWPLGRPVGQFVPRLLAYAGTALLGLPGVYLLGFLVLALNAILAWRLAKRILPSLPALVVALVFVLAPSDTTRIFPTYALQLNVAHTFALLAAGLLVHRRTLAAMPLFALVLLTYETPSAALFILPLLAGAPWVTAWRRWLSTWAAMTAVTAAVLSIRLAMSEGRVVEALEGGLSTLLERVAISPFLGAATSLRLLITRPIGAMDALRPVEWLLVLCYALALAWVLAQRNADRSDGDERAVVDAFGFTARRATTSSPRDFANWSLFVGALAWLAGYALSFTHWPPQAEIGRGTSVHGAANLGIALTVGALVWRASLAVERPAARTALRALVAGLCALLVGFHLTIQRAFVESWRAQKQLWRQVVALCPDLEEGTRIFFRPRELPFNRVALVSSWADPLVLPLLFRFPSEWSDVPRAFALDEAVVSSFRESGGAVEWRVPDATWRSHIAVLDRAKVIVLTGRDGRLHRPRGKTLVNSVEIVSKRRTRPTVGSLPRGPLFELLLGDELPAATRRATRER